MTRRALLAGTTLLLAACVLDTQPLGPDELVDQGLAPQDHRHPWTDIDDAPPYLEPTGGEMTGELTFAQVAPATAAEPQAKSYGLTFQGETLNNGVLDQTSQTVHAIGSSLALESKSLVNHSRTFFNTYGMLFETDTNTHHSISLHNAAANRTWNIYHLAEDDSSTSSGGLLFEQKDPNNNFHWRFLINSEGRVGIGTQNPGDTLHLYGQLDNVAVRIQNDTAGMPSDWALTAVPGDSFSIFNKGQSAGTITLNPGPGGRVNIRASTNPMCALNVGGEICEDGDPDVTAMSSRQVKRDITSLTRHDYQRIADDLSSVEVVYYRYKWDAPTQPRRIGVIAEDAPRIVATPDGKRIRLAEYTSYLLAAAKGQQMEIRKQQEQIESLERRLHRIEQHCMPLGAAKRGKP